MLFSHSTKEQRQCFFEHLLLQRFREERGREREGEREAFRVVFYTVRSRGVKVCVFYRDPSFGPEKKTKKKSLPNNERPKMHRRRQQPVVARLSLLPLSREESPIKE